MTNDRDHHGEPRAEKAEPVTVEESIEELKPLGAEAPEVVDMGAKIGARRLARPLFGDIMTSFIGGLSVSFGVIAMAWADACFGGAPAPSVGHIAGALLFPIGFVILLIGKGELFTENFFLPVTAIIERQGRLMQLLSLWAVSLAFNLLGCLLFAYMITRPGVLVAPVTAQIIAEQASLLNARHTSSDSEVAALEKPTREREVDRAPLGSFRAPDHGIHVARVEI